MFNKQFFLKHQGKLLWLLNTPVVCLWFRYVLRIHGEGSSVSSNKIRGILPHVIFWYENGKRKAEFRTHAKFSKRLYYAFRPVWDLLTALKKAPCASYGEPEPCFGKAFFERRQPLLIYLLNNTVTRRWFRWVLRIHGAGSDVGYRNVIKIVPNAIWWKNGKEYVAEFRTHAKYSKRIYYAFYPLWWTLHAWDWCVADRWVPELSFGFSTLTAYPDADPESTSVDGNIEVDIANPGETWATIRGRSAGTGAWPSSTDDSVLWMKCATTASQYRAMARPFYLYDTSALTAAAAINAGTKSVFGSALAYTTGGFSPDLAANIVTTTPASDTDLVTGDFDQQGTVVQCDTAIGIASWNQAGYNNWALNAAGLASISKTAITKLGIRENNYDRPNTAPTWTSEVLSHCTGYFADQTGTANDPKLVVTYTAQESYITITKNWALE